MILPWNCKEIFMGFDLKKFNQTRDMLDASGIKYIYRVANMDSVHGWGQSRPEYSLMYYIYVHRKDFDAYYSNPR